MTDINNYWWVGLVILIVAIILGYYLIRIKKTSYVNIPFSKEEKPKQKFTPSGNCIHSWKPLGHVLLEDKLRLVKICDRCGISIHIPIYTVKQLKQLEEGE